MPAPLKTIILQELDKQPNSGYGLIKQIAQETGWSPSYGSIHPQLNKLKEEGLIQERQEKNKKIWSLSPKGKKSLKKISPELIKQLEENMNLLAHLLGVDEAIHQEMMSTLLQAIQHGEQPFSAINDETMKMKRAFWRLYKEGKVDKNKEKINLILQKTTKELEKL